jgi:hypothetical protein
MVKKSDAESFNWTETLFVGRVGEFLFEQALIKTGVKVSPYGYEHTARGLLDDIKLDNTPPAIVVRNAPDFLVLTDKGVRLFQIKTTGMVNKNRDKAPERDEYFTMKNDEFDIYKEHWSSVEIAVVSLRNKNIYRLGTPREDKFNGHRYWYFDSDRQNFDDEACPLSAALFSDDGKRQALQRAVDEVFSVLNVLPSRSPGSHQAR